LETVLGIDTLGIFVNIFNNWILHSDLEWASLWTIQV